MRTAQEIMQSSFEEAARIVARALEKASDPGACSMDAGLIAASNLAVAIFSYEAEMEALKEAKNHVEEDDDFSMENEPI